jgi:hypothetical protein
MDPTQTRPGLSVLPGFAGHGGDADQAGGDVWAWAISPDSIMASKVSVMPCLVDNVGITQDSVP